MCPIFVSIIAIAAFVALWLISAWRRLAVLDENVGNAMNRLRAQLSSCFDALTALLDITKSYAGHESVTMIETIKSGRKAIMEKSGPGDVMRQEKVICEALSLIARVADQYPEIKANRDYIKEMGAVEMFESMVRTSRLIYNDNVSRLNREIRMFPCSMVAWILGFRQRDYLVEQSAKYPGEQSCKG